MSRSDLPPASRVPRRLEGLKVTEYLVCSLQPEGGPPGQLAVGLNLCCKGAASGGELSLMMVLADPRLVDELIAALEWHRNDIWPQHKPGGT